MRQCQCSSLSLKGGGTHLRDLCLLSWRILQIFLAWETRLLVQHIPSHSLGRSVNCVTLLHKRRLPIYSPVPTCDIWLVLRALSTAPFEPLQQASLKVTTYKAFVLLALMLGARRGELIALCRGPFVCPAEDWSFVLLYTNPSFIPKTSRGRLPTEPYKLRALLPSSSHRNSAKVLCLVRALKAYMDITADPVFVNKLDLIASVKPYILS